jgi:H+-translocating NAD(P) transhydrogenase subunit alpha
MKVGILKEAADGEKRVALIPAALPALGKSGIEFVVESGAGDNAGFSDDAFREKGAVIVQSAGEVVDAADILVMLRAEFRNGSAAAGDRLRSGQVVIGFMDPLSAPAVVQALAARGVTAFAMEMVPRITRAQSMDALSSMASIAGYKAVVMAADSLPRLFPMMTTAAGTISPARVFVIGAGVAGLQAIATARRLGAVVHAYDVRPAVKEQVQSLGAKFVEMELETGAAEDKGGYAKAQDEEFYRRQRELMTKVLTTTDVVVTTAAIPGMKAPILITADMVRVMPKGSVIVDLAAERGGNCELTRPGETVVVDGVTICGPLNLASALPFHASQMYAKNISSLLVLLVKKGELTIDTNDEVVRDTMVAHNGQVTNQRVQSLLGQGETKAGPG